MKPAHADRLVRQSQCRVGRDQPVARIAGTLPAEVHEAVERDSDLGQVWVEQVPDQARLEIVAACRDRRVRGEHDSRTRDQPRLFERHLSRRPQLSDALDCAEEAVSLVEVEHPRHHAELSQRPHSTDPEHDLLAQAAVRLGHIEPVGDGAQVGWVGLQVGVEQEQRYAPDLRAPDADLHLAIPDRRVDLDALHPSHRQLFAAVLEINLDLAAFRIDLLAAETLLVEQADSDQWQAKVAGGLQVIAREHAEAAGVDRQALGQAELEREVRDDHRGVRVHEGRPAVVVLAIAGASILQGALYLVALERLLHTLIAELGEQQHRTLARGLPELGAERLKHALDPRLPRPQEVVGELVQFFMQDLRWYRVER